MPSPATVAEQTTRRSTARRDRYTARSVLWRESSLKRVRSCGRYATGDTVGIKVTGAGDTARAGLSGVVTCGSVWSCPVCSEKINAGRQAEIVEAVGKWQAGGHAVALLTLTMQHHQGQPLAELWDALSKCWNAIYRGSAWSGKFYKRRGVYVPGDKERFGVAGTIRVVEVKHGSNGWHPHVHALIFLERELTWPQMTDLESRLFGRWERALAGRGLSVLREVGIDLRRVQADRGGALADYFTKSVYTTTAGAAAFEVTGAYAKSQGKGGRAPFELLRDFTTTGDLALLLLWHEYEAASRGRRQLVWTRGLRERLALLRELTDEQLAEDDTLAGELVARIGAADYKNLARVGAVPALLEAAERGRSSLSAFLLEWEVIELWAGFDDPLPGQPELTPVGGL